jgi:hypothetical protein
MEHEGSLSLDRDKRKKNSGLDVLLSSRGMNPA